METACLTENNIPVDQWIDLRACPHGNKRLPGNIMKNTIATLLTTMLLLPVAANAGGKAASEPTGKAVANAGGGSVSYALCVGLNQYRRDYISPFSWLDGCVPDANRMWELLTQRGAWTTSTSTRLLNSSGTKDAIRRAITNVAAKATSGDVFFYYHSSHGGNDNDNYDVYLCTFDADYTDKELAKDLAQFSSGVRVVVMVDACFSGGLFKSATGKKAVGGFDFAKRVSEAIDDIRAGERKRGAKVSKITSGEIGWLTAADYNQYSWDGFRGGEFTQAAIKGWTNGVCDNAKYGDRDGFANFYELWNYAKDIATGHAASGEDHTDPQCHNTNALLATVAGWAGTRAPTLSAPTSVAATSNRTDGIAVTWDGGTGAHVWNVWRSRTTGRAEAVLLQAAAKSPYLDRDPELAAGTTYHYWIEAANPVASAWSGRAAGMKTVALSLGSAVSRADEDGGEERFEVAANTSWSATSGATWIVLTAAEGNGDGTCEFTVAQNAGREARQGEIVVTAGTGTPFAKSATHTVVQAGNSPKPNLAGQKADTWPGAIYLATARGSTQGTTNVWSGETVLLNIRYANLGEAAAGMHLVEMSVKDAAGATVADWSWTEGEIAPGGSVEVVDLAFAAPAAGTYTAVATLDAANALRESDESDNELRLAFAAANPQTVTFVGNGGIPETQTAVYAVGGRYHPLPAAAEGQGFFDGWWTAASGGEQVRPNSPVTTASSRTLWAHWTTDARANLAFCIQEGRPAEAYLAEERNGSESTTNLWAGETAWLNFSYANAGHTASEAHRVEAAVHDEWGAAATNWSWSAAGLGAGAERRWGDIAFAVATPGRYMVSVALDTDGSVEERDEGDNVLQWAFTAKKKHTATFDGNGGEPLMQSKAYAAGEAYGKLPDVSRPGYSFQGWWTERTGGDEVTAESLAPTATEGTLWAHWTANTYEATLDFQGGTGGTPTVATAYGEAMPDIEIPTRTGYLFGGYYSGENGTGAKYYAADGTSARLWDVAGDATLHAKWTAVEPRTVWRFYSKSYKGHFFTIDEAEAENLIATNPNWSFEGGAYRAYTNQAGGTVALHRFYSKKYKGHFFTIDEEEKDSIIASNPSWKYEGTAYYVYPDEVEGSVPIYRFWSKTYRHHFYTMDEAEKDTLIATNPKWKYECIAFWALPLEESATKGGAWGDGESSTFAEEADGGGEERSSAPTWAVRSNTGTESVVPRMAVTTSDGTDGSAVADGDEETGWSPGVAGAGWVALSFEEPVELAEVVVAGDGLPDGLRVLWSEDAEEWFEGEGKTARYVWVAWAEGAEGVVVREVWVLEGK